MQAQMQIIVFFERLIDPCPISTPTAHIRPSRTLKFARFAAVGPTANDNDNDNYLTLALESRQITIISDANVDLFGVYTLSRL